MSCSCRCHDGGAFLSCDTGTTQPGGNLSCSPCARPGMADAGAERPVAGLTGRDLWDATDRLTQPTYTRLVRDNGHAERVRLDSLLDQLVEAMNSGETGGAHGVPASKPPVDAAALSLLVDITNTVRDALRDRGIKRTFRLGDDLRALTSAVNTQGDPARIAACTRLGRSWAAQIKATISNDPDRTWRLHGAACRVCAATTVPVFADDGTETRQPALIVHSEDGRIESIECGFCGSLLTGPMMLDIVREARKNVDAEAS